MSFIRGSCTGPADAWLQLSDAIVAAATGTSVKTVAVSAGGSGSYQVGDILTLTTGTFTVAAQVEVTSVSGGAVTGVRLYNAGVYSVAPSSPSATSGGGGTGATITNTTGTNGWTAQRDNGRELSSVDSIANGGSGYSVNDIITLAGGVGTAATIRVTTVSGGAVTGASVETAGDYDVPPTDPVAQASVAPSGGSAATFNLTFQDGERDVILKGNGDGGDEIFVGWRTFSNVSSNYYNFELHGMTGYDADVKMQEQPNVSTGFYDDAAVEDGCYLLAINTSLNYWLSVTSYRIVGVIEVGSAFFNFYLGWGNRFATESEYPYPMCVAGHCTAPLTTYGTSTINSGLVDPRRFGNDESHGPMEVLMPDGTWYQVDNEQSSRTVLPARATGGPTDAGTSAADKFAVNVFQMVDVWPAAGTGTPPASIRATPGTDDAAVLLPAIINFLQPTSQVVMELDNVYWTSGAGGVQSKDRAIVGSDVYSIFQNCNRTELYSFLAIKEI
jgi:hypothetical protein